MDDLSQIRRKSIAEIFDEISLMDNSLMGDLKQ